MDGQITDTLGYETGVEPSASGPAHAYPLSVGVDVERSQVKAVEGMISGLFQGAGPLQPFVDLAVKLVMQQVEKLLKELIQIHGSQQVAVKYWGTEPPPVDPSCQATSIPAGTYVARLDNDIIVDENVTVQGSQLLAATGVNHGDGTITIISDGTNVTGKVNLHGTALGHGGPGVLVEATVKGHGVMAGTISGPASAPVATVTVSGSYVATDPLGGQHAGQSTSTYTVGLHLTTINCAEVDGDLTAMIQQIYDQVMAGVATPGVTVDIKVSGNGSWAAIRQ
jgi:hypothetical protein